MRTSASPARPTPVRSLAVFLAAALLPCAALPQQPATWHGLHFGDTREQVRSQLTAQGIATQANFEEALVAVKNYEMFLPGLRYSVPLLPSFHFTDAGGLMDVTLTLDDSAMRRQWSSSLGVNDPITFAQDHLAGALAGLYGIQPYHSPSCDTPVKDTPPTCVLFWNGPQQTVLLERNGPHVFIRYQMLATDL